jgi:homoserine O-succinyltransferase
MGRFVRGESRFCPPLPQGYFDVDSEEALLRFSARACGEPRAELMVEYPETIHPRPLLAKNWHAPAVSVLRNWLTYVAERKR